MGDPGITIAYPDSGQATKLFSAFIVWGVTPTQFTTGRQRIHATLNVNKTTVYQAKTLHASPPYWGAYFRGVQPGKYLLKVFDREGGDSLVTPLSVQVIPDKGKGEKAEDKVVRPFSITTVYPAQNATVSTSFYAYGSATDSSSVSGTMTLGNTVYNGVTQYQPGGSNGNHWGIQFNVESGTPYTLDVWNANGSYYVTESITVS